LYVKHPGILAGKGDGIEVVANAIFLRFPNEKPEKPTFTLNTFYTNFAVANGWRAVLLRRRLQDPKPGGLRMARPQ
jgi:hypothetical protein